MWEQADGSWEPPTPRKREPHKPTAHIRIEGLIDEEIVRKLIDDMAPSEDRVRDICREEIRALEREKDRR